MDEIVALVWAAIEAGERITVHGDFDVDGVSATALLISTLRDLGADCDWLIPDRIADGYGLSKENVEKLAERGTGLLITVDCGITAVEQVALAQELGMEVIVTDHHQRDEELPACLILHPEVSNYPFTSLCGTAVAWKLACALREGAGSRRRRRRRTKDLDLVALATVADVVPLVGENRSLVKRGLAEMRRTKRVGLRALMEASKCEPTPTRRGGPGVPAGAADQRGRAAVPGRCRGRAAADRRRGAGEADRRGAGTGELGAAGDRARGRRGRRGGAARAAGRAEGSERAGAGGRGVAPRRGRDRRLAAGRAPPPPGRRDLPRRGGGRARLGPQHPRLRSARGARGVLRAPRDLRRPQGRGRAVAEGREPGGVPRRLRRARRRGARRRRTCCGPSGSTRWSAGSGSASTSPKSSGSWPRSGWATPACG